MRSATIFPELEADCTSKVAFPLCTLLSLLSLLSDSNALTRPSFRVRLAFIPCRIQTSSSASFLSNNLLAVSSAASCCSRNIRNFSKEPSNWYRDPLSSSAILVATFCKNDLSCVTKRIAPLYACNHFSSHSIVGISR